MLFVAIVHLVLVHRQHDIETLPNYQPLLFDSAGHVLKTVSLYKWKTISWNQLFCQFYRIHGKHQFEWSNLTSIKATPKTVQPIEFDVNAYHALLRMPPKTLWHRQHFGQYIDNVRRPFGGHLEWPNYRHRRCAHWKRKKWCYRWWDRARFAFVTVSNCWDPSFDHFYAMK